MEVVLEKAPKDYAGILATTKREKGQLKNMKDQEHAMKIQICIHYVDTEAQCKGVQFFSPLGFLFPGAALSMKYSTIFTVPFAAAK